MRITKTFIEDMYLYVEKGNMAYREKKSPDYVLKIVQNPNVNRVSVNINGEEYDILDGWYNKDTRKYIFELKVEF